MAEKQTAKRNRREEILQSLALMLESSDGSQRITTAKLAASVGVSEAALYRHFPSKTRMFDSLIEFIEDSLITRINLILKDEKDTTARLRLIVLLLLGFGERNPGLTRILTGHALMFEQDRLQGRINQLFERIEAQLRHAISVAADINVGTIIDPAPQLRALFAQFVLYVNFFFLIALAGPPGTG